MDETPSFKPPSSITPSGFNTGLGDAEAPGRRGKRIYENSEHGWNETWDDAFESFPRTRDQTGDRASSGIPAAMEEYSALGNIDSFKDLDLDDGFLGVKQLYERTEVPEPEKGQQSAAATFSSIDDRFGNLEVPGSEFPSPFEVFSTLAQRADPTPAGRKDLLSSGDIP